MATVRLADLSSIATQVKAAARAADTDNDGKLTDTDIAVAVSQQKDGFGVAQALNETANWARFGKETNSLSVDLFDKKTDEAQASFAKRDKNADGALEGQELVNAQKLKLFNAYAMALPDITGPLEGFTGYNDILDNTTQINRTKYEAASEVPAALGKAIITAANESSYKSTTLAQVFKQVDQGEVIVRSLEDPVTRQLFLAVEYGAGDNTYGAIFDGNSLKELAGIHDGDLSAK